MPAGWLEQLTGLAGLSPAIGMVGPVSNYAAPPQLVEEVPYRVGPKRCYRWAVGCCGCKNDAYVEW